MYSLPSTASLACVSGDGQSLKRPASFPTAEHVLVNAFLTRSGVLGTEKSAPPRESAWNVEDDLSQGSERYLLPPRDGQEESSLIIHVGTNVTGSNRSSRLLARMRPSSGLLARVLKLSTHSQSGAGSIF